MIIEVDTYEEIRKLHLDGVSQRSIASKLGISRQTVKKYCDGDTVPWVRKEYERPADIITDEIKTFILGCLKGDQRENLKSKSIHLTRFMIGYSKMKGSMVVNLQLEKL